MYASNILASTFVLDLEQWWKNIFTDTAASHDLTFIEYAQFVHIIIIIQNAALVDLITSSNILSLAHFYSSRATFLT